MNNKHPAAPPLRPGHHFLHLGPRRVPQELGILAWLCLHSIVHHVSNLPLLFPPVFLSFSSFFLSSSPPLSPHLALSRHRPGCARAPCNRPALRPRPDWPIIRRRGYYYPSLIYFHFVHPITPPLHLHRVFALSLVLRPSASAPASAKATTRG